MRILRISHLVLLAWLLAASLSAAEVNSAAALHAATMSIRHDDLKHHVSTLADDTFEGREAGSRGGRAAGIYLGQHYQRNALQGGGEQGYYQTFGPGYSNILGVLPGSDPALADQVIIVSAHYDHVGYGSQQNSYGPTGYIHNGADDNASGVAGLLEAVEAFAQLPQAPRRTIVFALWDGEEKGLLGSKHWISQPTVPLGQVACMVNMDMIGRLRNEKVEIIGTRTAPGLRRAAALANRDTGLLLDCTWEMVDNSDHYPFFQRNIPVLMLHTGLHDDYHRPSDDVERIEFDGMQRVTRLLFQMVYALANEDARPAFRGVSRGENLTAQRRAEQPLPPPPGRLGVRLDPNNANGTVRVSMVDPGTPAALAGMQAGDEIVGIGRERVIDMAQFRKLILAAESPTTVTVRRGDSAEPLALNVQLKGAPVRLGISWRVDEAEPGAVILTRVIAGSVADEAGLQPNDRIYQINGRDFDDQQQFRAALDASPGAIELLYERHGRIGVARVELPPLEGRVSL